MVKSFINNSRMVHGPSQASRPLCHHFSCFRHRSYSNTPTPLLCVYNFSFRYDTVLQFTIPLCISQGLTLSVPPSTTFKFPSLGPLEGFLYCHYIVGRTSFLHSEPLKTQSNKIRTPFLIYVSGTASDHEPHEFYKEPR